MPEIPVVISNEDDLPINQTSFDPVEHASGRRKAPVGYQEIAVVLSENPNTKLAAALWELAITHPQIEMMDFTAGCLYVPTDDAIALLLDVIARPSPSLFAQMFMKSFFPFGGASHASGSCPHEALKEGAAATSTGGVSVFKCTTVPAGSVARHNGWRVRAGASSETTCQTVTKIASPAHTPEIDVYTIDALIGMSEHFVRVAEAMEQKRGLVGMSSQERLKRSLIGGEDVVAQPKTVTFPVDYYICNDLPVTQQMLLAQTRALNDGFSGAKTCRKQLYPVQSVDTRIRFSFGGLYRIVDERCGACYQAYFEDGGILQMHTRPAVGRIKVTLCPGGSGILGAATFPDTGEFHGVFLDWRALPGGQWESFNDGGTLVHELGHYFGLQHTFHGGCKSTDAITDTNQQEVATIGSPDTLPFSCGVYDQIHNFMDYTNDDQLCSFTEGQKVRMWFALQHFMSEDLNHLVGKVEERCNPYIEGPCVRCVRKQDDWCWWTWDVVCADYCAVECKDVCADEVLPTPAPKPTEAPTTSPTQAPTSSPTVSTATPTKAPTGSPTALDDLPEVPPSPTPGAASPTKAPTGSPTAPDSPSPVAASPTKAPTGSSTAPDTLPEVPPSPTPGPTSPTKAPTGSPTAPDNLPEVPSGRELPSSEEPVSEEPSAMTPMEEVPISGPMAVPDTQTATATARPSPRPTSGPTQSPAPKAATAAPSAAPTPGPTATATSSPTPQPTQAPSAKPTPGPTAAPSPTPDPTQFTAAPTAKPIPTPTPTSPAPSTSPPPKFKAGAEQTAEAAFQPQEEEPVRSGPREVADGSLGSGDVVINKKTISQPTGDSATTFGDPHVENILHQRFQILHPGEHTMLSIPRGVPAHRALLHVQANVSALAGACLSMYITGLDFGGRWLGEVQMLRFSTGGTKFNSTEAIGLQVGGSGKLSVEDFVAKVPASRVMLKFPEANIHAPSRVNQHATTMVAEIIAGPVSLKVSWVSERVPTSIANSLWLSVRRLKNANREIGGLLGADDHSEAARTSVECNASRKRRTRGRRAVLTSWARLDGDGDNNSDEE